MKEKIRETFFYILVGLFILSFIVFILAFVVACVHDVVFATNTMERISLPNERYFSDYAYYRDKATDVMYIKYKKESMTVMLNPDTGYPLTYSDYVEFFQEQD